MQQVIQLALQLLVAGGTVVSNGFLILSLVLLGRVLPEHAYFFLLMTVGLTALASFVVYGLQRMVNCIRSDEGTHCHQSPVAALNQLYVRTPVACFIGFLMMLNYVLAGFGSAHVSGVLQGVLSLANVPFTIVFSVVLLGHRPVLLEVLGAVVVMAGAVVSIIPSFTSSNCQRNLTMFQEACLGQNSSGCIREDTTNGGLWWEFLYLLSVPPLSCISVISEYFLKTTECPQMTTPSSHMNGRSPLLRECSRTDSSGAREIGELNIPLAVGVSNTWLLFWLLLAFWVNLIPGAVPSCVGVDSSLSALGENLKVAVVCTFTGDGGWEYPGSHGNLTSELHFPDDCSAALPIVVISGVAVTVYLITQLYFVKYQSAVFVNTVSTIGPLMAVFLVFDPVLTFGYRGHLISGATPYTWAGLAIILLGIMTYKVPSWPCTARQFPQLKARDHNERTAFLNRILDSRLAALARLESVNEALPISTSSDYQQSPGGDMELLESVSASGL